MLLTQDAKWAAGGCPPGEAGQPSVALNSPLNCAAGCGIWWKLLRAAGKEGALLMRGKWC